MSGTSVSIPAPVGGWNAKDAVANMKATDAVILKNWFPTPGYVSVRPGMVKWATGLPGLVNSVMSYNAGSTSKLFAASGTGIYDVTAQGAVGAAVVTGLSSTQMLHTNVPTPGGNFLLAVNSVDKLNGYNGTTWWKDGDGTHDITGFDTTKASNIYLAKQRVWMVEKNSLRVWYLATQSIGGAATSIDFSSLCRRGGYLVAIAEWTTTGGFGMQDFTVFVTSEGEVLIYQGYDPSSATTWLLDGVYYMGSPMGPKCFCKAGTDLLYISKEGLVPLSQGKFFSDIGSKNTLTDKIQWAISTATTTYAGNWGWQVQPYPLGNALLLNIPVTNSSQEQYVMNTVTGAWSQFTGWHANAWDMMNDQIYFGDNTFVGKAWVGNSDAGNQINADALQAFNYFKSPGLLKRWTMMRPIISASGIPAINANINVDFESTSPSSTISSGSISSSLWDTATWDNSSWAGSTDIYKQWQGVTGVGYCAAPRLLAATNGYQLNWMSTDLVMERGSIL